MGMIPHNPVAAVRAQPQASTKDLLSNGRTFLVARDLLHDFTTQGEASSGEMFFPITQSARHENRGEKELISLSLTQIYFLGEARSVQPNRFDFPATNCHHSRKRSGNAEAKSGAANHLVFTQNAVTDGSTTQKASKNGKTIRKQPLSPPPEQSAAERWKSQPEQESQPQ